MKRFFGQKRKAGTKSVQHKRRIVVVISLFVLFTVVLNLVEGKESFASFTFHLYFVSVMLATYFAGRKAGLLTVSVAIIQGMAVSGIVLPNILFLCFSAGLFIVGMEVILAFNKRLRRISACCDEECEKAEAEYNSLLAEDRQLAERNNGLEAEAVQLAEMYEVSKTMGACLDFKTVLEVMHGAICRFFKFGKGMLLLKQNEGCKEFDFSYSFDSGEAKHGDIKGMENDIIRTVMQDGNPLLVSGEEDRMKFNLPSQVKSFLAVPVILSGKVIGVATLEDFALRIGDVPGEIGAGEISPEKIMGISSILMTQFVLQMQKARLYEKVEKLSIVDGLTQVVLRRYFMQRFEEELKRSRHYILPVSFLMIDIDHFKNYNDKYGHLVGDAVLKEMAATLCEGVRDVDLVGRYGGEEFCVMLPETDADGAYQVAERVRWLVENSHFKAYDEETLLTVSIGVSSFPADGDTEMGLIDKADEALLRAKKSGRNQVCKA